MTDKCFGTGTFRRMPLGGWFDDGEPCETVLTPPATAEGPWTESRLPSDSAVHHPPHYTKGGIETIDVIRAKLGEEGFRAYCIGNVLKYTTRFADKNGKEDLEKAQVYLGWALTTYG